MGCRFRAHLAVLSYPLKLLLGVLCSPNDICDQDRPNVCAQHVSSKIIALCNFFELFEYYGYIDGTFVSLSGTWYKFFVESNSSKEVIMTIIVK